MLLRRRYIQLCKTINSLSSLSIVQRLTPIRTSSEILSCSHLCEGIYAAARIQGVEIMRYLPPWWQQPLAEKSDSRSFESLWSCFEISHSL